MITGSSDAIMDNVYLKMSFVMAGVIVMMEVMNGDLTVVCKLICICFLTTYLLVFLSFHYNLFHPKDISAPSGAG